MLSELRKYSDIISSYTVYRFERVETNTRIRARLFLIVDSILDVRGTVLAGSVREYAYHWQNQNGQLHIRWDNAPHWPNETFPHHKHIAYEDNVEVSYERTLGQVLNVIQETLEDIKGKSTSE